MQYDIYPKKFLNNIIWLSVALGLGLRSGYD
jgi:hypothetical protein